MSGKKSSYSSDNVSDLTKDIYRLKMQASVAKTLEKKLLLEAGVGPGMKVLDLGCGPGIVSSMISKLVSNGKVVGVDINESLIEYAKENLKDESHSNLEFLVGDAYNLPVEENSFDFVYSRFVFQHLENPEEVVQSALKALKPGGVFCIADSDSDWWTLYPEPEGFNVFKNRVEEIQAKYGGDKKVGRKLSKYLSEGGFDEVNSKVHVISSYDIGMSNFLDITMGYKNVLVSEGDARNFDFWQSRYTKILKKENAHGFSGVFICTGKKPS